jgi:hypothetical protein
MDIKKKLFALAVTPVLSLLAAVTYAAEIPIDDIDFSANGTEPATGILKNQNDCPDGEFFKNVSPGLTNGSLGGTTVVDFLIDGKNVAMTITWGPDIAYSLPENSFAFSIAGGYAQEIGVTTNTNTFTYDYRYLNTTSPLVPGAPVQADSELNKLDDVLLAQGEVIADVNHLDLCLATLDEDGPVVTITSPADGADVSGDVSIVATIRDEESGLDPGSIEIVIVNKDTLEPVDPSLITGPIINGDVYTWTFKSGDVPTGPYLITVSAKDKSILANVGTAEVTVEVIRSLTNCLGILDDPDLTGGGSVFGDGCNPTGQVNVQANPDINLERCNFEAGEVCSIGGELLEADPTFPGFPVCDACGVVKSCGAGAFPDPRMAYDSVAGRWYPKHKRDLNVFEELGGAPDVDPGDVSTPILVLDQYTYGYEGCFGVVYHFKNFLLSQAYDTWPQDPLTGLAFVKTYFPEDTWEDLPDRPVAKCYAEDSNFDLQQAAEFGYQTTDRELMVEDKGAPWTETCGSGRTLTRNKSFDIWNIIETDDLPFDPADPVKGFAVLDFKYQLAEMKFTALFTALDNAQPTLLTGRFSDVSSPVNQAKRRFDNLNPRSLQQSIDALEDAATAIKEETTWEVTEENWPGDALGRIENLIWRLTLLRQELIRLEAL